MGKGRKADKKDEGIQGRAVRKRDKWKQSMTGHMYEVVTMKLWKLILKLIIGFFFCEKGEISVLGMKDDLISLNIVSTPSLTVL